MPSVWSENPLVKWSPNRAQYIINLRKEVERLRIVEELNPMNIVEVLEIILTMIQKASVMPMKAAVRMDMDSLKSIAANALYHSTHLRPSHD